MAFDLSSATPVSSTKDSDNQEADRQKRLDEVETAAKAKIGDNQGDAESTNATNNVSSNIGGVDTSGFKGLANKANEAAKWYSDLTTLEQLAVPASAYFGIKTLNLGFRTLEDKLKAQTEIKKQRDIFALKNPAAPAATGTPAPTVAPTGAAPVTTGAPAATTGAPVGQVTPQPQNNYWNDLAGETAKPMPLGELKTRVENLGAAPEGNVGQTATVETTIEPPKLSEWASGTQPTVEAGTTAGMKVEPTFASTAEQTAIDALNGATATETPPATNEPAPAPKEANAPVKPKKPTTTVTLQPTGELPTQLAEIKGSIPPRVQQAAAAVPPGIQAKLAAEGKVGLKGYGSGDVSITNTYGKNAYAAIVDYFNNGQPIGTDENYKKVQAKINKGLKIVPGSGTEGTDLIEQFASKLPASEAEAGTFGSRELGEKMAYTADGKIVTSPNAIKKAVAKGGGLLMALSVADAAFASSKGDTSTGGDVLLGAIPGVGPALGLYHGEAGTPTAYQKNPDLQRPEVRQTLEKLKQTLSPVEYEKAANKYLNKVGSFAGMTDRERLMVDIQSRIKRQPSKNTLLP
ncbi:hypothetical protein UFOVP566_28 [uncultured Caudovirales phage]|uniref:Uncharacterized protein n=1 Tax=uncultured Caudovirales phage TaxID=2100421 RepID=A0A6J5LTF9_9CAUD|nr:hypothetical protein UFOVP294_57 [uncultured Caudovirales phage]CAB4150372.1 hypothetical protein UFOVP566_28 [uncultured Caudovirales phage]